MYCFPIFRTLYTATAVHYIATTLPPRSNGCNFAFNELQINFTLKKIWSGKIDAQSGSKLGKWAKIDSTSYRRWRSILTAEEVYKQKCRKISEGAQWTILNQKNPGNLRSLTHRILGLFQKHIYKDHISANNFCTFLFKITHCTLCGSWDL